MKLLTRTNSLSGLLFVLLGAAALWTALDYPLGTIVRLGPGAFPLLLSCILIALGLAIFAMDVMSGSDPVEDISLQSLFVVPAAVVAFAVLARPAGMAIALAALLGVCCLGRSRPRLAEALILFVVLLGLGKFVFVDFLGVPLRVIP